MQRGLPYIAPQNAIIRQSSGIPYILLPAIYIISISISDYGLFISSSSSARLLLYRSTSADDNQVGINYHQAAAVIRFWRSGINYHIKQ